MFEKHAMKIPGKQAGSASRRANQKLCVPVVLPMVQTLEILKHVSTVTLGINAPKSSLEHKTVCPSVNDKQKYGVSI